MKLISIITDSNGNIVDSNNSISLSKLALVNLEHILPNQKKLLANILEKNYTVFRLPLKINNLSFNQYIFEEWKIDNNIPNPQGSKSNLNNNLTDIKKFSDLEQEIIYSLLSGYTTDKDIEHYIQRITKSKIRGSIRYAISTLYTRFNTNNKIDLIEILKQYGFDRHIPKSLFPLSEYPL